MCICYSHLPNSFLPPTVSPAVTVRLVLICLLNFMKLECLDRFCELSKVNQPQSDSRDSKPGLPDPAEQADLAFPLSFPSFSCGIEIAADGSEESS